MALVGLTGGYATGKSAALAIFESLGARVIDCDLIAREVVEIGSQGLKLVQQAFGGGILDKEGRLDRAAMARAVFSDDEARRKLESILHPLIIKEVFRRAGQTLSKEPDAVVMVDAPLLFETGMDLRMDHNIVVSCGRELQISRAMARDRVSRADAEKRIEAQAPLVEKERKADYNIYNAGSLDELHEEVANVWERLGRAKKHTAN